MSTLALIVEYDGTNYSGWQIQPNGKTIQEEIQKAYFQLTGQSINLIGSGRTDAGVHASGQVASTEINNQIIPSNKLRVALNSVLPYDIKVIQANYFEEKFHARFDAIERKYNYLISDKVNVFKRNFITEYRLPFSKEKLIEIAPIFLGKHDFTSLSKYNPDIKNNICNVTESEWQIDINGTLNYHIKANHFLYGMVRATVGIMLKYARGKISKEEIQLSLQKKDRRNPIGLVPPIGLYLTKVYYPNHFEEILYRKSILWHIS